MCALKKGSFVAFISAKLLRSTLIAVLAVLLLTVLLWRAPAILGCWLVVADPLEPARAIVVLTGHLPFRAMEAALLYREGWAPEVWLTVANGDSAEDIALARLGLRIVPEHEYTRLVLTRLGVQPGAIRELEEEIRNTADEMRVVARELVSVGADRVIIITSKVHTRRVKLTWQALAPENYRSIVRYAREDPYRPNDWWQHTGGIQGVVHEAMGLINLWAGFAVKPDPK